MLEYPYLYSLGYDHFFFSSFQERRKMNKAAAQEPSGLYQDGQGKPHKVGSGDRTHRDILQCFSTWYQRFVSRSDCGSYLCIFIF